MTSTYTNLSREDLIKMRIADNEYISLLLDERDKLQSKLDSALAALSHLRSAAQKMLQPTPMLQDYRDLERALEQSKVWGWGMR